MMVRNNTIRRKTVLFPRFPQSRVLSEWREIMVRLIIGVKGTGKTKQLIEQVHQAYETSKGSVVCIDQGDNLKYDINHKVRLIDAKDYMITDGQSLFGFVAGIYASNHDITDIFIDAALRICQNDMEAFKCFIKEVDCFSEKNGFQVTMTSSIPFDTADSEIKSYVTNWPQ